MKNYFSDLPMKYDNNNDNNSGKDNRGNNEPSKENFTVISSPETMIVMGCLDLTKEAINCLTDYAKCREHEKTERKRITEAFKAIKYQIDAQKEVYLAELEKRYEERFKLYDMTLKAQEVALETSDKEMLMMCYDFILEVYNDSVDTKLPVISLADNKSTSF